MSFYHVLAAQVVFDDKASWRVRQEALLFMMDHTQGFQEEDDVIDAGVETSKVSKRAQSGNLSLF